MARLEHPRRVIERLRVAQHLLSEAHNQAGEVEGGRTDLIGPIRDMIFGINSAVSALIDLIEEKEPEEPRQAQPDPLSWYKEGKMYCYLCEKVFWPDDMATDNDGKYSGLCQGCFLEGP